MTPDPEQETEATASEAHEAHIIQGEPQRWSKCHFAGVRIQTKTIQDNGILDPTPEGVNDHEDDAALWKAVRYVCQECGQACEQFADPSRALLAARERGIVIPGLEDTDAQIAAEEQVNDDAGWEEL